LDEGIGDSWGDSEPQLALREAETQCLSFALAVPSLSQPRNFPGGWSAPALDVLFGSEASIALTLRGAAPDPPAAKQKALDVT
jgi:hypothetical protein